MSGERFIVSELLNFLQNEVNNVEEDTLCDICMENFEKQEIIEARKILYESLDMKQQMRCFSYDRKGSASLLDIINRLKVSDKNELATFVTKNWRKLPLATMDNTVKYLMFDISSLKESVARIEHELGTARRLGGRCTHGPVQPPVPTTESPEFVLLKTFADANAKPRGVYGKIDVANGKFLLSKQPTTASARPKKKKARRPRSSVYEVLYSEDSSSPSFHSRMQNESGEY